MAVNVSIPQYRANIYSTEAIIDPYRHYAELRALGPVVRLARPPSLCRFPVCRVQICAARRRDTHFRRRRGPQSDRQRIGPRNDAQQRWRRAHPETIRTGARRTTIADPQVHRADDLVKRKLNLVTPTMLSLMLIRSVQPVSMVIVVQTLRTFSWCPNHI